MSPSSSDAGEVALVEAVKAANRCFPTGVMIVTTQIDGSPYGLALNAFSSLSLEPPRALVCVATSSATHPLLFRGDHIAVNVLAHDQGEVAARFARSGGDKFRDLSWEPGEQGAPILLGSSAHLELELETRMPAGTHTIFVGQILAARANGLAPLVYLDGEFLDGTVLRGGG